MLPLINQKPILGIGEGDEGVQSDCFRLIATDRPENMIPWPKPENYDPKNYELVKRYYKEKPSAGLLIGFWPTLPNGKSDINSSVGISTNLLDGSSWLYPDADYENRDPRLNETIVEFGTPWLGFIYQPHPDSVTTVNVLNNNRVTNNDSRGVAIFASFTGMLWKKGVEQRWADNPRLADPNLIILRYADILLMHAESLIELNEDLGTARNLINQVRARAYGVGVDQTDLYPAVFQTDQNGLKVRLRRERRVELMREGLRYQDIIRWRIGNKAIARLVLGMPQPTAQDRNQWPFINQILPLVDQDGIVLFDSQQLISRNFASLLQTYSFDVQRMYLWPIPASDRFLNSNLTQNPGY